MMWPLNEAERILQNLPCNAQKIVLQTGYGATGLPHIGTFGEIVRTLMVKKALSKITTLPIEVISFSDDLDTLRKVPSNIPNSDILSTHLGKPVSMVPDPFRKYESFGHYNNMKMKTFIKQFNFNVKFMSSYETYKSGLFNDLLLLILSKYREILDIMLPSLREERKKTYSPFIPILDSGLAVPNNVVGYTKDSVIVFYEGREIEVSVLNGKCKLQWKVDWAMRWCAFNVNYEMHGADLIATYKLSSQICKLLGYTPPEHLCCELFLDETRHRISKSKGNGISLDQWLKYTPESVLAHYMYQKPETAKRLCFDVIPREADAYINDLYEKNEIIEYIHPDGAPNIKNNIAYSMLLNLASACNAENNTILMEFIKKYATLTDEEEKFWHKMANGVVNYYYDYIVPNKRYRVPTHEEVELLYQLKEILQVKQYTLEELKNIVYEVGKKYTAGLKEWFMMIYQVLLGQESGPRLHSFIDIYTVEKFCSLINTHIVKNI